MESLKKITLILVFVLLSATLFAQSGELLMIRAYESINKESSKIVVTQNGKVLEEIELESMRQTVNIVPNQVVIDDAINHYRNQGYEIKMMTSGSAPAFTLALGVNSIFITTYLLKK